MGKVNEIYGTADVITYADTDTAIAPAAIEPNTPSTSGKTPNYGLPQWAGSDITDWFELNPAFEKIDEVMHANAEAVETSQNTGDSNTTAISNLTQSLNNTISRVTDVENVNTQQGQQITLNVTHLNEHDTAIQALQTAQAAMNETLEEVSGEAATSTADITDLKQRVQVAEGNISTNADNIGNMEALETSAKTNLVAAVNEIYTSLENTGSGRAFIYTDRETSLQLTTQTNPAGAPIERTAHLNGSTTTGTQVIMDVPVVTQAFTLGVVSGQKTRRMPTPNFQEVLNVAQAGDRVDIAVIGIMSLPDANNLQIIGSNILRNQDPSILRGDAFLEVNFVGTDHIMNFMIGGEPPQAPLSNMATTSGNVKWLCVVGLHNNQI